MLSCWPVREQGGLLGRRVEHKRETDCSGAWIISPLGILCSFTVITTRTLLGAAADDLIRLNQLEDCSMTEAELEPNLGTGTVYANNFITKYGRWDLRIGVARELAMNHKYVLWYATIPGESRLSTLRLSGCAET